MHGGNFFINDPDRPPHSSHNIGNDADGRFSDGSIENDWGSLGHHTAETARRILAALNSPSYGPRIACVGLSYTTANSDAFYTSIRDVTLADGRHAVDVIRPWAGHGSHFHLRISDIGDIFHRRCTNLLPDGVP
jgi:hypothetical protein